MFRTSSSLIGVLLMCTTIGGCNGIPEDAYRLPPSSLEQRSMQTFTFEGVEESEILAASVALIQDMEYNIDEIERPLGVLTASKVVDADSAAQKAGLLALDIGMIILAALSGSSSGGSALATADDEIALSLTMVVTPSLTKENTFTSRITLQRTLYDQSEQVKERGVIDDPEVYQQMYDKLSKAVFLEGAMQ
jgi:hypothetical protein